MTPVNELEKLTDQQLEDYRAELEERIAETDDRNIQTIIAAAIRAAGRILNRRQRPWLWEDANG
jgi:hypothetical protein